MKELTLKFVRRTMVQLIRHEMEYLDKEGEEDSVNVCLKYQVT